MRSSDSRPTPRDTQPVQTRGGKSKAAAQPAPLQAFKKQAAQPTKSIREEAEEEEAETPARHIQLLFFDEKGAATRGAQLVSRLPAALTSLEPSSPRSSP